MCELSTHQLDRSMSESLIGFILCQGRGSGVPVADEVEKSPEPKIWIWPLPRSDFREGFYLREGF